MQLKIRIWTNSLNKIYKICKLKIKICIMMIIKLHNLNIMQYTIIEKNNKNFKINNYNNNNKIIKVTLNLKKINLILSQTNIYSNNKMINKTFN